MTLRQIIIATNRLLHDRGERDQVKVTIVCPGKLGILLGEDDIAAALQKALNEHGIESVPDFPVNRVTEKEVWAGKGQRMDYDLLMLNPPFQGPREARYIGATESNDFVRVDHQMRATGADRMYAAGDCVDFPGPKMGHMAVLQGEVAAANLAACLPRRTGME